MIRHCCKMKVGKKKKRERESEERKHVREFLAMWGKFNCVALVLICNLKKLKSLQC